MTFVMGELGTRLPFGRYTLLLPLLVLPVVLLRRASLTRVQSFALIFMTVLTLAGLWAFFISLSWISALAVPVMAASAFVCARYPAAAWTAVLVVAFGYGTLFAFLKLPGQKTIDVFYGGLWLATIWHWTVGPRKTRQLAIWPGVACVLAFILLTAAYILTAENINIGLHSFRQSIWYLSAVILIAYAPWSEETRRRIQRAAIAITLVVGAYATYRWQFGPAAKERQIATTFINNFLGEELKPIGSFFTTKELAGWTTMAIPFMVGMAISMRGRWRLVAALGVVMCTTAMFAADVRAAPASVVPGVLVVFALYQLSQGYRGRRGATVAIAIMVTMLVGGGAFALTLGDSGESGPRYRAILDPGSDAHYQARLIKWRTALDDIDTAPFGHGLGTSGVAQKRFGRTQNIGNVDVDSSYIKVAYEQGFVVGIFFMGTLVLLLIGLARRALVEPNPDRAGPAIAACGVLTSMMVLFFVGTYIEGPNTLMGWTAVGLGVSQFTLLGRRAEDAPPEPAAEPDAGRLHPWPSRPEPAGGAA